MKKIVLIVMLLGMALWLPAEVQAQSLGGFLKNAASALGNKGQEAGKLGNIVTSLLGKKDLSAETLAGTWEYSAPAIVFESDNLLSKAGGVVAEATLEKKISEVVTYLGLKPGVVRLELGEDESYTCTFGKVPSKGTYSVSGATLKLKSRVATIEANAKLTGKELQLAVSADKLFTLVQSLGSSVGGGDVLSSLTSLLKSYKGMQIGLTFTKV